MVTFVITGKQTRKPDGLEVKRRFVVNADTQLRALELAHDYAQGYFQYGPLFDVQTFEIEPDTISSFSSWE